MAEVKRKRKPRAKKEVAPEEVQQITNEETDFAPVEDVKSEEPVKELEPVKSKIKKVDLEKKTEEPVKAPTPRNSGMFRVFVRGIERMLTKPAIEAASKDPSLRLEIPEDTDFELPNVRKCKDC